MNEETHDQLSSDPNTLYIGADVGATEWKLAASNRSTRKPIQKGMSPFDEGLLDWIVSVRGRLGLEAGAVVFTYEAGRDGFSIARWLEMLGIECLVVDPASIEMSARRRRAKTDRLDAKLLLTKTRSFFAGDRGVFAVVRIPDEVVEDERRVARERKRLKEEVAMHKTRIRGLLALHGLNFSVNAHLVTNLRAAMTPWGTPVPKHAGEEILHELERLELAQGQLDQLERAVLKAMGDNDNASKADRQGGRLMQLSGIGKVTAMTLPREFFWRDFKNSKEVGSAAGLTGTPRVTGTSTDIEQGISKAGNSRVRTLMIELAWIWVRRQPDSPITHWFKGRQDGTKRSKRKAIVAVARKLLIALWRYATQDIVPEGAHLKLAS